MVKLSHIGVALASPVIIAAVATPVVFAVDPSPAACSPAGVLKGVNDAIAVLRDMQTQANSIPSKAGSCSFDNVTPLGGFGNDILQHLNQAGWDSPCGEFSPQQGDDLITSMNTIKSLYQSIDSTLIAKKDCILAITGNIKQVMNSVICLGTVSARQSFPVIIPNLATQSQQSQAIITYGQIQSDIFVTAPVFGGDCSDF